MKAFVELFDAAENTPVFVRRSDIHVVWPVGENVELRVGAASVEVKGPLQEVLQKIGWCPSCANAGTCKNDETVEASER